MKHRLLYIPIAVLLLLSFADCAKKGNPSGGPRDTIPPKIVRSKPENYSTHFKGDEIEILFDEYIKLNNLGTELVISPPLTYDPIITPLNVSKTLKIKILDTLLPNTTYSFNFGRSIEDNNEGNVFEYFKYVFSTGSYIDSLTLKGRVRDAKLIAPEFPALVMLYEINESYSDSIVYSKKPTYVTVTKDSTGVFEFTNLKEGTYQLIALYEKTRNYTFQPESDKIGFAAQPVRLPSDSSYVLTLFKEDLPYRLSRPQQVNKNQIIFGYTGIADSFRIKPISEVPPDFEAISYHDRQKDSIHYWFKPETDRDSIVFEIKNNLKTDTAVVRIKNLYADSLKMTPLKTGTLKLKDSFKLAANTPLVDYNPEKLEVFTKDSTFLKPEISLDSRVNTAAVSFPKKEDDSYTLTVLPGAFTDFFGKTNDTLSFRVNTKPASEYGTLRVFLENISSYPVLIQLADQKYKVVSEAYLTEETENSVYFDELNPDTYYLRIIYDENNNRKWDSGNFLNRKMPEQIIYYPKLIEVRANWSLNETFILNNKNSN